MNEDKEKMFDNRYQIIVIDQARSKVVAQGLFDEEGTVDLISKVCRLPPQLIDKAKEKIEELIEEL